MAEGKCIIFFVRKKAAPNESFITVELLKKGLWQVMYSNNRQVHENSVEYAYCKNIGDKLLNSYDDGKINAFSRLSL